MDNSDAAKMIAQIDSILIAGLAVAVSAVNNPFTEIPIQLGILVVLMLMISLWGIIAYIAFEIMKNETGPKPVIPVLMIGKTRHLLMVSVFGTLLTLAIIMMIVGYYYIL